MTQEFPGDIRLPGDGGAPLPATMILDHDQFTLHAGEEILGSWKQSTVVVQRDRDGAFLMSLGGEDVYFKPVSPSEFATAVTLPLQPEPANDRAKPEPKRTETDDIALPEVQPLRSVDDDDDILSPRLLTGIVTLSVFVVLAVFGMMVVA